MATQNYIYDSSKIQLVGGVAQLIVPTTFASLLIGDVYIVSALISLVETVTKTGSDNIQYQFVLNNTLTYWNGSAWAASNGSFAQSNSVATINANAASLVTASGSTLQVQIVFSGSGSTAPSISNLVVNISAEPNLTPVSGECQVYCYLQDILGDALTVLANAPQLVAVNDAPFFNNGIIVPSFSESVAFTDDPSGAFASISIVQTANSGQEIRFMITYEPDGKASRVKTIRMRPAVIPAQSQINLTDLTSIDTSQLL